MTQKRNLCICLCDRMDTVEADDKQTVQLLQTALKVCNLATFLHKVYFVYERKRYGNFSTDDPRKRKKKV